MNELKNVEMTEEELDNVAGGVRTATFELLEDGRIELTTFVDERDVAADGTQLSIHHSEGSKVMKAKFLEKAIKDYTERGYEIIRKGF